MRMNKQKREKYTRIIMMGVCLMLVLMFILPIVLGY